MDREAIVSARITLERCIAAREEQFLRVRQWLTEARDALGDLQGRCSHPSVHRDCGVAEEDCPDCGCPMPLVPTIV